jgi:hypothetical protein
MGRPIIDNTPEPEPPIDREREFRDLGRFLVAHEPGGPAAEYAEQIRAAQTLAGRWAVIDELGLREAAERHLAMVQRIRERNARGNERAGK